MVSGDGDDGEVGFVERKMFEIGRGVSEKLEGR